MGVHERFLGREGLALDHEERLLGSEVGDRVRHVRAVDVRHEVSAHPGLPIRLEGQARHHRAEVASADADVDDVGDPLAGVSLPRAAPDGVGELAHLGEDAVDPGHDVLAIDQHRLVAPVSEGGVEHRAVFGAVDLVAGEHAIAPLEDARLPRQIEE